jgi:putative multiple sugar transport system substrate-binding protein
MKHFVRKVAILSAIALLFSLTGLAAQAKKKVGIAMPTQSSARWIADGANLKAQLEKAGYTVDLQYAEDNIDAQVAQLENMITKGVSALVIASIDGESLTNVLEKANASKIPVIAYDRLIRNSPYVSYYATFDNFLVGVQQATTLVKGLGLDAGKKGPFNIELFAGSPDDNNAGFFFNGAMSILNPYIKSGVLVVKSGQVEFAKVATLRWDGATAQQRMDNILTSKYTDAKVDAVLSPYDGISIGILSALKSVGYGTGAKKMPLVSGQDAELPSVKSILAGEQYSTIFKDTRTLAAQTVKMVDAVLKGSKPEINDTKTYNNGKIIVPSFLCTPVPIDKTNAVKVLVTDSAYYKADQLK